MKNTHTVTIIHCDGTQTTTECNAKTQYEVLKAAVGGYIETLPYFNKYQGKRCVAYCNEEGKLKRMPFNIHGQDLWLEALKKKDGSLDHIDINRTILVGNIAIVTKGV